MDIRLLLSNSQESSDDVSGVFAEIKKEFAGNSDRGIAVIAGSMIDSLLEDLLETFLVKFESKNDRKNIFSSNAPLSSFHNKIQMAYSLGLISNFDKELLIQINSIRNIFAHQINKIHFDSDEIKNKCKNIVIPDDLLVAMDIERKVNGRLIIEKPRSDDYRSIFKTAAYVAMTILASRKVDKIFDKCVTPVNFSHRTDFIDISITTEKTMMKIAEENISFFKITEKQIIRMYEMIELSKKKLEFFNGQRVDAIKAEVIESTQK
ncbi:hypothetical protein LLS47_23785 [Rouxiella badensis]|uniref:hypothetical protein n=1 Tax=Rouxiella badensis TaxID=1646377 RepID=UPI001D148836|nr:hypothetical protein [Rouxiella badensis]MCC3735925.1 hypothetical protein [Rouxiella badensis]MCC3761322.1 hypothetical protein [Rouxiella badensis]